MRAYYLTKELEELFLVAGKKNIISFIIETQNLPNFDTQNTHVYRLYF